MNSYLEGVTNASSSVDMRGLMRKLATSATPSPLTNIQRILGVRPPRSTDPNGMEGYRTPLNSAPVAETLLETPSPHFIPPNLTDGQVIHSSTLVLTDVLDPTAFKEKE